MTEPAYTETQKSPSTALTIAETPMEISPDAQMAMAEKISKVLKKYLSRKKHQVVFNGRRYPEADDWNVVAAFFGFTAKITHTETVNDGENGVVGYIAHADLVRDKDCAIVSAAEAQCSRDERNWKDKPAFQLRSMAQTRACAKAIKNKFAWVMVLAGLTPTPAEEMTNGDLPAAICSECGFDLPTSDEVYYSRKTFGKTLCKVCQKKATPLPNAVQNGQERLAKAMSAPVNEHKRQARLESEHGVPISFKKAQAEAGD